MDDALKDVFISYSRLDEEFVLKLYTALRDANRMVWVDKEDIPPASDWSEEIKEGIQSSQSVLFVLSPNWINSRMCNEEFKYALEMHKRLIGVVRQDIPNDVAPPELGHSNWIMMRAQDDFQQGIQKIITAIDTDQEWAKIHRRLLTRALDWETKSRDPSLLLYGKDLENADLQLTMNSSKKPYSTEIQREYVFESKKASDRRRRTTTWMALATTVVLAALAIFAFFQANIAQKQAAIAHSQTLIVNSQMNKGRAGLNLLLNIASLDIVKNLPYSERIGAEQSLQDALGQVSGTALINPDCPVETLAFSPNGRWLVTGSDETACLWDAKNLSAQPTVLHQNNINTSLLLFSPDSQSLIAGGCRKDMIGACTLESYLWDLRNLSKGPTVMPLPYDSAGPLIVAFSPDGRWLAVGNAYAVKLLDLENSSADLVDTTQHQDSIVSFAFSPDGKQLATVSVDGAILLTDMSNPRGPAKVLANVGSPIKSVAFSPDGKWLSAGGKDGVVRLWEINAAISGPTLLAGSDLPSEPTPYITSVAFSPDSQWLTASHNDKTVTLYNVQDPGEYPITLYGATNHVVFSPDGQWLVSGGEENTTCLWETKSLSSYQDCIVLPGSNATFSPDSRLLVASTDERTARTWDINQPGSDLTFLPDARYGSFSPDGQWLVTTSTSSTNLRNINNTSMAPILLAGITREDIMAFSPDSHWLAYGACVDAACAQMGINLRDLTNPSLEPIPLKGYVKNLSSLAFSANSQWLAVGAEDGITYVWNTNNTSADPLIRNGKEDPIATVALSPDGKWLATGSESKTARLWDLEDGSQDPITLQSRAEHLAFSPNGRLLAASFCADDPTPPFGCSQSVMNWIDLNNPVTEHKIWKIENEFIEKLVFSPDNMWLAIGGRDSSSLTLWNLKNQSKEPKRLPISGINDIIFSPNSQWLGVNSLDNTISLWNLKNLDVDPLVLKGHKDYIFAVLFGPDSQWLVTSSADGTARRWYLNHDRLFKTACQLVGRNFTRAEWEKYIPGIDYPSRPEDVTCPQWPLHTEAAPIPASTP